MNYRSIFIAAVQTTGLYASGFIIPLIGQMLALITPIPLILVYVRNGREEGIASLGASTVLILLLGGWQAAAILLFSFGLMAIGIAEGMKRQMKHEQATLLGGLLPIAVIGIIVLFYLFRIGKSPINAVEEYLRESITAAATIYTKLGLTDMAAMVTAVTDSFVYYLARLMPGITIAMSLVQAATCYGMSRAVIIKKDAAAQFSLQPSLASWYAPDAWVWGLIASLACIVVPQETSRLIGWNLAIIFAVVYLSQGMAIVEFFLRKANIKPFVRGLVLALILALPSIVFVIALGIVDIWADVRKVRGPVFKT
jgi:uncharacterized protein YybS (DUF2232 family)